MGARARVLRAPRALRARRRRRGELPLSVPRRARRPTSRRCSPTSRALGGDEGRRDRRAARADADRGRARRCAPRRRRCARGSTPAARCSRSATAARRPTRWTSSPTSARAAAGRALDLTEDPAIITALANDIGIDAIFSRQVIAYGGPGDALLALSTSGNSANVIAALVEARRRGLVTIALRRLRRRAGGGGGARRPRRRHPLRAHPADPGGAGERVPRALRACVASEARSGRGSRGRCRASASGPFVYRLAPSSASRASCSTTSAACSSRSRAATARSTASCAGSPTRRRRWPRSRRCGRASVAPAGERGFAILASPHGGEPDALVSPDTATCDDCLRELFDPADRRYRYPFVNCTNCGPRFTIVRGVPYDRPLTTMAGFAMCAALRAPSTTTRPTGASTPSPTRCPECGPTLRLLPATAAATRRCAAAVAALRDGRGRRGQGHRRLPPRLPRGATSRRWRALRARKHREDKPFAVMVRDVAAARALVELTDEEAALLAGRERPIVLAPRAARRAGRRRRSRRARAELGVMLPYSPLHHLLLADVGEPLVMTSGNVSDEPIAYEDDDALRAARRASPTSLLAPRPPDPHAHRRLGAARGPAPAPAAAAPLARVRARRAARCRCRAARRVLACGAELKSTFCVAKGARAWVGHHIGDLKTYETLQLLRRRGSSTSSGCSRSRPRSSPTTCTPTTSRPRYALEREGVEHVARPAPPRPPRRVPGRARRDRAARSARSTTARATARDGTRLGRRAARRRPARLRARRPPVAGAAAGRRRARSASRGGWRARGCSRRAGTAPLPGAGPRRAEQVAELVRTGLASPRDDEHGPAVRRRRRAVRPARRGHLRGPGGDRARGRRGPGRSAARTTCR